MLKKLIKTVSQIHIPHRVVHGALAGLYTAASFGADKTLVGAGVAACYMLMTIDR